MMALGAGEENIWACVGGSGKREAGRNPSVRILFICRTCLRHALKGWVDNRRLIGLVCSTQDKLNDRVT